jgi:ankyrin repeat protein
LFAAASTGHPDLVQVLLTAGANIEVATASGITPLGAAAAAGHVEVAQLLLSAGANIAATDAAGQTPLHSVVHAGNRYMVQLLLQQGADPRRRTALHAGAVTALTVAAGCGDAGTVQHCWSHGGSLRL